MMIMKSINTLFSATILVATGTSAFHISVPQRLLQTISLRGSAVPENELISKDPCYYYGGKAVNMLSRRSILGTLATTLAGLALSSAPHEAVAQTTAGTTSAGAASSMAASSSVTLSDSEESLTDVYFGVGCFWHIQHEFVGAERDLLGRKDHQLTAKTGYAGGRSSDKEGRVCYHNFQGIADYGKLGHGEVVGLTIPQDSIEDFAKVYFSLFDPRTKNRVDPQDRGSEYRSLLGLPGGTSHPMYEKVEAAATATGFSLLPGKGNDADTLGKQTVWVYDTAFFPFHQAEVYHQYHDDFQSPPYGRQYNNLANVALEDGRIMGTGCPDRI